MTLAFIEWLVVGGANRIVRDGGTADDARHYAAEVMRTWETRDAITRMAEAIAAAKEGQLTPVQRAVFAAAVNAAKCEPWWRWTCHLAVAIVMCDRGLAAA